MWWRYDLRPSTAIGMLMAVGLLFLALLGVALLVLILWGLLTLAVFFWMKRHAG